MTGRDAKRGKWQNPPFRCRKGSVARRAAHQRRHLILHPTADLFGGGRDHAGQARGLGHRVVVVAGNAHDLRADAHVIRIVEAAALEDKARTDLEAARRNVAQATRTAFLGVVSGLGQVKALEAAEASSQTALDANKLGYQVGVRINIDVLNAQSQLFQTKRDLAQARYNVLLGGLRLKQASGRLVPEDLLPINSLLAP